MRPVPALEVRHLTFRYYENGKKNIVDDLSLTVEAGSTTVILGNSGCGKSTFASVCAGLYPENGGFLESGEIELFGKPLSSLGHRERSGYYALMFQNPDLQFCMNTLRKELIFCLENICTPPEDMEPQIERVASDLKVSDLLDRKFSTMSGGEKQKASLCCLIALGSRCIVLDEALANIDRESAYDILEMLKKYSAGGGTIIAIDHLPQLWKGLATRYILMGDGCRIIEDNIRPEEFDNYKELLRSEGVWGEYSGKAHTRDGETGFAISLKDFSVRKDPKDKMSEYLIKSSGVGFRKGRMTALLGKSGIGKTTTFLSILKQHPYEGKIEIDGRDLRAIKERELFKTVGIVFQNPADQFITQKVADEVMAGASKTLTEDEIEKYLADYGLIKKEKYSPYMLSQGQQRRLAVLSVLLGDQKILLLDEPTYGQDLSSTEAIMRQLEEKVDRDHFTVLFITHDRELAEKWADDIVRIEDGGFVS
ncbi:MAG: ABC transporter ATP-binding protein [Oscillospiraceae bacterium]|nr:ABC transporter ATP-binding protein [Oscillospiraceae bacterium]